MQLDTMLDLIKLSGTDLTKYKDAFICSPFYSERIYGLTYEENESEIGLLSETMRNYKKDAGCDVLELFGGKAFDSFSLSKEFSKNRYNSVDCAD